MPGKSVGTQEERADSANILSRLSQRYAKEAQWCIQCPPRGRQLSFPAESRKTPASALVVVRHRDSCRPQGDQLHSPHPGYVVESDLGESSPTLERQPGRWDVVARAPSLILRMKLRSLRRWPEKSSLSVFASCPPLLPIQVFLQMSTVP